MKPELITNSRQIEARTGIPVEAVTLQSTIFLEGPGDRLPLLVRGDDGQAQTDRRSAGCDDELIIGAGLLRVAVEVADGDGFLSAVDLRDLAVREDVDTTLFNICREQGDKIVCFVDHVADEIGQITGTAADVVGALKDRDVEPTDRDAWL